MRCGWEGRRPPCRENRSAVGPQIACGTATVRSLHLTSQLSVLHPERLSQLPFLHVYVSTYLVYRSWILGTVNCEGAMIRIMIVSRTSVHDSQPQAGCS